jgi:hypothetical protein
VDDGDEQAWLARADRLAVPGERRLRRLRLRSEGRTDGAALLRRLRPDERTPVVATPQAVLHGFRDVQPYLYWSCAARTVQGPCRGEPVPHQEWSFSLGNGFKGTDLLANELYVMVYYPGSG